MESTVWIVVQDLASQKISRNSIKTYERVVLQMKKHKTFIQMVRWNLSQIVMMHERTMALKRFTDLR